MAPTSKSNAKGTNPAPDFTATMNRIQLQLEARLNTARSFLPSRSSFPNPNSNPNAPAGGAFTSLTTTTSDSLSNKPSPQSQSQSQSLAAEEAEFAEDRALDPNAGIGMVRPPAAAAQKTARERDTATLRGRLLGKRGRGGEQKWMRREEQESSDEEAGRSGLGRAKKLKKMGEGGKRSREEMEEAEGEGEGEEKLDGGVVEVPELPVVENAEDDTRDRDRAESKAGELPVDQAGGDESGQVVADESSKRKRRKKKKKKSKGRITDN
ncbi:hypothetical protein F5B20DRAFT_295977 [Whalleya microplaca]|nr:hypothetical protein F5B20DRAFT_295977 [Whalleya microplaca]